MLIAIIVAVAVIWMVIGLVVRLALMRRGHRHASLFAAALFGPLLAVALLRATAATRSNQPVRIVAPGEQGAGSFGVLIGVDASPEAHAAVKAVLDVFGSSIGRITLATVIDHEFRDAAERQHVEHEARTRLDDLARVVVRGSQQSGHPLEPELIIVAGEPAAALVDVARGKDVDLLAVGRRGAGMSKILLGSVATQLAREAPLPVLIVGA